MKCTSCGHEVADTAKFCNLCGTPMTPAAPAEPVETAPAAPAAPAAPVIPVAAEPVIPPQNKPLSPWAYFGFQLLFSIPLVGFICLIVFSLDNSNINRRNFARSYWCSLLVGLIITIIAVVLFFVTGAADSLAQAISELPLL